MTAAASATPVPRPVPPDALARLAVAMLRAALTVPLAAPPPAGAQ